ncbi:hypothetical protein F5Y19DRAFT_235588 [Xylariaceae sp. FL1651]|nr:hypothetical protein F5Y19DRAFT_235588 [Xylariaceae sp. FL1651]
MTVNTFDRLLDACEDFNSYPTKLLRSELFPHALRRYSELLDERASRVFSKESNSECWKIRLWDLHDGQQGFPSKPHICNTSEGLRGYLLVNRKDPKCRHIFVRAPHSRAPLNCSRQMLLLVFTFHQVMAQFLDVVLFFGTFPGLNVPTAFHRCVFRHEHFLDPDDAHLSSISQLGRSGIEIRYCYNLWSVEKSDSTQGKRAPWELRQAGIYHSLDLKNGRATWIHVKANDSLEKRIKEVFTSFESFQASDQPTVQSSFSATLLAHIIMFEWCCENWRQYLHHWECELEKILTTIRKAPIHKVEKVLVDVKSSITGVLGPSSPQLPLSRAARRDTLSSEAAFWGSPRRTTFASDSCIPLQPQSPATLVDQASREKDPFQIFEEFKFEDLQHLHHIGSKLHEADMVLRLNLDVLVEVMEYFKGFLTDPQTKPIVKGCNTAMSRFVQRTIGIVRELETEKTRILTLTALLNDGKALFDATRQFRNIELNRLSSVRMETMTQDMHQSALQMEGIAGKTERETSSMHTITLVTLLFLPGTFVAVRYALSEICKATNRSLTITNFQTFLGAGFYEWPNGNDVSSIPSFPVWRLGYFALFAEISFPLMALTILVWLGPSIWRWVPWGKVDAFRRGCICGIRRCKGGDEESQIAQQGNSGGAGVGVLG